MLNLSLRILVNIKPRVRNNSKRFSFALSQRRCAAGGDPVNEKFLMQLLDIRRPIAKEILQNHPRFYKLPRSIIIENYILCEENGISRTSMIHLPNILVFQPFNLKQRFLFYKELGCSEILPPMITLFRNNTRLTVGNFKIRGLLKANDNVVQNLLKHVPGTPSDVPELKLINDECIVGKIYNLCKWQFLKWKLEITDEEYEESLRNEIMLSKTALTTLREAIEILETELGFSKARIRKHIHLLGFDLYAVPKLIDTLKIFGDVDCIKLIQRYPKLLHFKTEELQKRINVIINLGIPKKSITVYPDILCLPKNTIMRKVKEFKSTPELQSLWCNPRILNLIYCIERVKKRLKHLKELDMKCISLYLLTCDHNSYAKHIEDGNFRTKGTDLLALLDHEFGNYEFIHDRIRRHSMWCRVPLDTAYETLQYLKERNYSNDDIYKNIQIVLYKRSRVEKELNKINTEKIYQSWQFTSSQKLTMCLYNIEKKHHFNGHGIFDQELNENTASHIEEEQNS